MLSLSKAQLRVESRAIECLEHCAKTLGLASVTVPVPVEHWIERPLGFKFGVTDLSHLGEGVLGAAFTAENEILIHSGIQSNNGRFRFTCAHELGHMVLHADTALAFRDGPVGDDVQREAREREADRFAAAFLMPIPLVVEALYDQVKGEKDPKKQLTELLNGGPESEDWWKVRILPAVADRFDVSLSAATLRFVDMRLRDRRPMLPESVRNQIVPRKSLNANAHAATDQLTIQFDAAMSAFASRRK